MVEILVVLGIFAMLLAMGLSFSFDSYRGYLFRAEYGSVVNIISIARNRSANNFDESAHGISVMSNPDPDEYRLYAVNTYVASNPDTYEAFPKNTAINITGSTNIVFEQLSGSIDTCTPSPCEINFQYGLYTKTIAINAIGSITF